MQYITHQLHVLCMCYLQKKTQNGNPRNARLEASKLQSPYGWRHSGSIHWRTVHSFSCASIFPSRYKRAACLLAQRRWWDLLFRYWNLVMTRHFSILDQTEAIRLVPFKYQSLVPGPRCSSFYPTLILSAACGVQWGWYSIVVATVNPVIVWSVVSSWEILQ